jgi:hypothetical protein
MGPGTRIELVFADLQSATWPLCHPGMCAKQCPFAYLLLSTKSQRAENSINSCQPMAW